MSFLAKEGSVEDAKPVEAYKFEIGSSEYRYTSSPDEEVAVLQTYAPLALARDQMLQATDERDGVLELTVPGTTPFARLYINIMPNRQATLTVYRWHRTDGPTPEVVQSFQGYVQSVSFSVDGRVAKISVRPDIAVGTRPVPRFMHQGGCNNVLFDEFCQVDQTDPDFRAANMVVTGSIAATLTVAGLSPTYPDGWFTGGVVEQLSPSDYRLILEHVGDTLTLLMPFAANPLGGTVHVYAGCNHDVDHCANKFFNYINYGGDPYIPLINPYASGIG